MKLRSIYESLDHLLDKQFDFHQKNWLDPDVPVEMADDHFTYMFQKDPPPGITPINAVVSDVQAIGDDYVTYKVRMTLEDYIRNNIEYGNDPYDILKDIKLYCGPDAVKAAYKFMKNQDNSFKVARIGSDGDGGINYDSYNAKIDF